MTLPIGLRVRILRFGQDAAPLVCPTIRRTTCYSREGVAPSSHRWTEQESNLRHQALQASALPTELSVRGRRVLYRSLPLSSPTGLEPVTAL